VVGLEQRRGVRQRLDAERDRGRHQRAIEAVLGDERRAALGIVVGELDGRLGLTAQAQHPARGAAYEPRRLAAAGQLAQQRLGPQVLVDVDRGCQS
jgi:hypothetical protein